MDSKVVQKTDPNNQELKLTRNQLEIDINWTQNEHKTVFATEKSVFLTRFSIVISCILDVGKSRQM